MTFPKALEFLHNRVGKHNTVLSLTEVIIVLAALSAKVNFFPGVGGSREDNRQRLMPLQCASGWECQEQCGLKDRVLQGKIDWSWWIWCLGRNLSACRCLISIVCSMDGLSSPDFTKSSSNAQYRCSPSLSLYLALKQPELCTLVCAEWRPREVGCQRAAQIS